METRTGGGGIPLSAEGLRWSCTDPVLINLALNGETFSSKDQNWIIFISQYMTKIRIKAIHKEKGEILT